MHIVSDTVFKNISVPQFVMMVADNGFTLIDGHIHYKRKIERHNLLIPTGQTPKRVNFDP
jgi:hypothetical protein